MKTETSSNLTTEQFDRLKRLSEMGDAEIDLSDAPEVTDWSGAKRGLFYTEQGDKVAIGLDADLAAWFESQSASPEESGALINRALRAYVAEHTPGAS